MNPVLILTHNCLELTKRCVESVLAQDCPVDIALIDNGSTDETAEWSSEQGLQTVLFGTNRGVSVGWNLGLEMAFISHEHVLVLNNDTIIPPWFYRTLLGCGVPFVTGVTRREMDAVMQPPQVSLTDGPDFSAFLIRRECWEKVGRFDELMVNYCSDVDYDIRARALGMTLWNSHVPFYHERSSTLSLASIADRAAIQEQSHKDHAAFKNKYGMLPKEYGWYGSQ